MIGDGGGPTTTAPDRTAETSASRRGRRRGAAIVLLCLAACWTASGEAAAGADAVASLNVKFPSPTSRPSVPARGTPASPRRGGDKAAAAAAAGKPAVAVEKEKDVISIGMILPYSSFSSRFRIHQRKLSFALEELRKSTNPTFNFFNHFNLTAEVVTMPINPSPIDILHVLCQTALPKNYSVILYFVNTEFYGSSTALAQYFFQLAGYLGIPVFSWNAYSSGLEQRVSKNIMMQMAPSVAHQSAAMLSILQRYSWHQFSIVTSHAAGHHDFVQAVRDQMLQMQNEFRFTLLATIQVDVQDQHEVTRDMLAELHNTDTRIFLLYATREEAVKIFQAARELGLIGKSYMWIVTQSVIGDLGENTNAPDSFPIGALGVNFNTSVEDLVNEVEKAVKVFGYGLESFVNDPRNRNVSLQPNLSCNSTGESRWIRGEELVRYIRNVSLYVGYTRPNLEFNADGTLKYAELFVNNLNGNFKWEKFGTWTPDGLEIKDIVWPGNSLLPPPGVPEKYNLKVTFMEEPPFINLGPPDPVTGKCINRGVICIVGKDLEFNPSPNISLADHRDAPRNQCCSGFSIDLLEKFSVDSGFTYELVRVEDGYWGTEVAGQWNGLVSSLINHKADIVMTAFKINSMRETFVDFSIPFMETGIAIVVAKRTGIISPKAFLEPFDTVSWVMILLVSIHMAAFAIFLFEWLSPSGYNMSIQPPRDYKFSLLRTYWMVWADLFGASVNVDCPRSFSARFMSSVWAMFAVVFLAIYTANLAAFMITREEYHDLTGIEDRRLANPYAHKPPFRFGTIPYGNTEAVLQKNHPNLHRYMKPYNRSTVAEGIRAVKRGDLDAFIYDATVLEYLVGQDEDCKLLTVGTWYSMTGYGVGFPRKSKYLASFNRQMMVYRENGDLDRLQRFWLSGACHPEKQERSSSKPLSLIQFMSAFILLSLGIVLAVLFLFLEHVYFQYLRQHLAKKDSGGCCALLSLSMGKSLTFRGAVYETQDMIKKHRCQDPLCEASLWKVRQELGVAHYRIRHLEKLLYGGIKGRERAIADRRPFWRTDAIGYCDMTRNHVSSNDPRSSMPSPCHHPRDHKRERTEVAEIETVL